MRTLARKAEIIKLARVLRVKPSDLSFLYAMQARDIRAFREAASARLFDADAARLKRVATASKLLPVALIALIGEHVFGPLLCARVAGLIAPDRAAEVAQRMRIGFLADLTLEIDPRQVREVLKRIPVPRLVDVGMELARRGEFVTLARFVDYVSDAAIKAVLEKLADNGALLQIGFFMEDRSRLNQIVGFMPEARLRQIIRLSADEGEGLWGEALALMADVNPSWRKTLAEMAAEFEPEVLTAMARLTQSQRLWGAMLPIIAAMDEPHQERLLQLPVLDDDAVLSDILEAAQAGELWEQLMPMLALLPEPVRIRLSKLAEKLNDAALDQIFVVARRNQAWGGLLLLLMHSGKSMQDRVSPMLTQLAGPDAKGIASAADRLGIRSHMESGWDEVIKPFMGLLSD